MKLSEVTEAQERTDTIIALRDERRDIAHFISVLEAGETARVSAPRHTYVELSETCNPHVIAALRQEQAEIEKQLIDLGVEIDEAADVDVSDDDDDSEDDVEEAA